MVRVINTDPHKSVVKEVVCRNCGATLEYVPADLQKDYTTDYTGNKEYYHYIRCPQCSKEVVV